jgi:GT2 family glycosyltransferase
MPARPEVDVVIPFAGPDAALRELLARVGNIGLRSGDTVYVADNRPAGTLQVTALRTDTVAVLSASQRRSSYHARNIAAGAGRAPWLLFLDADVEWDAGVLGAYFDPPPADRTAIVGGGIVDGESALARATLAERYSAQAATMASANTLARAGAASYPQTANCLVRRAAFEAVGGFADAIRSGGDADLCFRLRAAGWELEQRPSATVVHRSRSTVRALLAQKARHGAGAAWVEARHPGTFPRRRLPGLVAWSAREVASALAPRAGGRGTRLVGVAAVWCFELGRLLPNGEARWRR